MTKEILYKAAERLPGEFSMWKLLEEMIFVESMESELEDLRNNGLENGLDNNEEVRRRDQ